MNESQSSISPASPAPEQASRRTFFRVALTGAGACYAAAVGYPVYRYLASPVEKSAAEAAVTEVTLRDAEKLPKGSALMFKFGAKPTMLIHHSDGTWVALTAVCTHLGCTVQYQPEQNVIRCACHGGTYNPTTGANVSGPPPKPLKLYKVAVTNAGVVVSRT
jgi:cytochrome b6-f complex iron-sulfur subunit